MKQYVLAENRIIFVDEEKDIKNRKPQEAKTNIWSKRDSAGNLIDDVLWDNSADFYAPTK